MTEEDAIMTDDDEDGHLKEDRQEDDRSQEHGRSRSPFSERDSFIDAYVTMHDGHPNAPASIGDDEDLYLDPTLPRWKLEVDREPLLMKNGKATGFGSWYQRTPFDYTEAERLAEQGHVDRVRTADLTEEHRAERALADDDSLLGSDWKDRTSVDPELHKAQKAAEQERLKTRAARGEETWTEVVRKGTKGNKRSH